MPREKKAPQEDEGIDESWLASWADGMTLLMAFFVMLYAFALTDETKFADFKVGIVTALGISDPAEANNPSLLESGNGIALTVGLSVVPSEDVRELINRMDGELEQTGGTVTPENVEEVRDVLEARFRAVGAEDSVSVEIDERGIVVRFPDRMLFDSGQATFDNDIAPIVLGQTSLVLNTIDNFIEVEGHTDNVPTGSSWPSNWELSGARASAVVRWFHQFGDVPEVRMGAIALSDTRPRATNSTAEGRAINRRVEVVITIDGLIDSDVDVINAIGDNVIFDDPPVAEGRNASPDSGPDTGADGADTGSEETGGVGSILDPVEIDPIRTGLEQP